MVPEQETSSVVPHGHWRGHSQYHKCYNLMLSATPLTKNAVTLLNKIETSEQLKKITEFLKNRRLATAYVGMWKGAQPLRMMSNKGS